MSVFDEYASSILWLPFRGAAGGTDFRDFSLERLRPVANGSAQITTTTSKYYGSSLYLPTQAAWLGCSHDALAFASAPWTVGCWMRRGGTSVPQYMFDTRDNYSDAGGFSFNVSSASNMRVFYNGGSILSGSTTFGTSNFNHFEVSYDGATLRSFANGVLQGTVGASLSLSKTDAKVGLDEGNISRSAMYMQDLYVIPGVCLHTASFTPPGPLLGYVSNTGEDGSPIKDESGDPAAGRTVVAVPRVYGERAQAFMTAIDSAGEFTLDVPMVASGVDVTLRDDDLSEPDIHYGGVPPIAYT